MSALSTGIKTIKWLMQCDVNGHCFEFNGSGAGRVQNGSVDLELNSTGFPDGFEPISCL